MKEFIKQNYFWLRLFIFVWVALAITFSFCNMTFFVSNHDYLYLRNGMALNSGVWEGRLSQFVFPWLLSGNQILPIINMFMSFAFYAAAAVSLAWFYGLEKRLYKAIPFVLLIVLNPYILSQIFYTYTILSIGCWHFFAVLGVILIYRGVWERRFMDIGWGIACLILCLAGYAPSSQLIATAFVGKFLLDVIQKRRNIRVLLKGYIQCALAVLLACGIVFLLIHTLKERGLVFNMYNVRILAFGDMFLRLVTHFFEPWKVMFTPMPHCPAYFPLLIILLFAVALTAQRAWQDKLTFAGCVLLLGVTMSFCSWISQAVIFRYYRINSFSYPYVVALMFAVVLLKGEKWQCNLAWGVVLLMLHFFIRADFMTQKVWYLGSQQDARIIERIRKDVLPQMVPNRGYRLATLGELNGQAKFAQKKLLPNYFDYMREYGYYASYLPIFFSHAFFITESDNPIIGDANFFCCTELMYLNNNEYLSRSERVEQEQMLYNKPSDVKAVYNALELMSVFPHEKYYFVGRKDIILRLGDDLLRKSLLRREIY